MSRPDRRRIAFRRLRDVKSSAIIRLMNDAAVRRHLPLAHGTFGAADCDEFVASKERMWEEHGYGPWAFMLGDEFVGWGGLQPEGEDADVGLVLSPEHWGAGRSLCHRILDYAFGELGLRSVIALLPPSRTRVAGMLRLGFREDGETVITGERFIRYRLSAPAAGTSG